MTTAERAELSELRRELLDRFDKLDDRMDHLAGRVVSLETLNEVRTELDKERAKNVATRRWTIERAMDYSLRGLGLLFVALETLKKIGGQ